MHRARTLSVLVALVAALASIFAGSASGSAAPPAAQRGLSPLRVRGATDLGRLAPRPLALTVALAPHDRAALNAFVAGRHRALSPAEFTARFGPKRSTVSAVRRWARAHGLRVVSMSPNRMLVRLSGSSTRIGRALGVAFESFRAPSGRRFFSANRKATLPASFSDQVSGVLGLSSLGRVSLHRPASRAGARLLGGAPLRRLGSRTHASSLAYPNSYGPKDLASLYHAPGSATGAGQHVAIITEGDLSQPRKDLVTFEDKFGLPHVTWNQVDVGAPSSDKSGDTEWDLDSQYSTGLAPDVSQLDVYVGTSLSNQDILATINRFVTDDSRRQGSFSAGECELLAKVSGFTGPLDAVLAQADAQGQSMFFSSGDTGSQCPALVGVNGAPVGLPGDNYPASSPNGIGVGGTTLLGPGPNEIAWYAGGGGSSFFEPTPAFQRNAGGSFLGVRRGVPDVSLDADPTSGYEVIANGTQETVGGTSASAPAWQGIWARAQGAHGGGLGFAGPVIYREPAAAFNDIVIGANGLYVATPGYDYITGRGTPDITAFVSGAG